MAGWPNPERETIFSLSEGNLSLCHSSVFLTNRVIVWCVCVCAHTVNSAKLYEQCSLNMYTKVCSFNV